MIFIKSYTAKLSHVYDGFAYLIPDGKIFEFFHLERHRFEPAHFGQARFTVGQTHQVILVQKILYAMKSHKKLYNFYNFFPFSQLTRQTFLGSKNSMGKWRRRKKEGFRTNQLYNVTKTVLGDLQATQENPET